MDLAPFTRNLATLITDATAAGYTVAPASVDVIHGQEIVNSLDIVKRNARGKVSGVRVFVRDADGFAYAIEYTDDQSGAIRSIKTVRRGLGLTV